MGGKSGDGLGDLGKLYARPPWPTAGNTELSKNTKEDAVASHRSQISRCKEHKDSDPGSDLCGGRWLPGQTGGWLWRRTLG